MLPDGCDAFTSLRASGAGPLVSQAGLTCPTWPPDLFAVVGRIIEESACYTLASPDRGDVRANRGTLDEGKVLGHRAALDALAILVNAWSEDPLVPPAKVMSLWNELVQVHGKHRWRVSSPTLPRPAAC